jgi:hypothetical protein
MSLLGRTLKTAIIALPIAIVAMALPAVILAATGGPQPAIVIFTRPVNPDSLPGDITILSWSEHVARLDGIDAAAARRLYAKGAALVMPSRKSGCMSYRKA